MAFKKSAPTTDRRYLPMIDSLEEYVTDFTEIDSTGETFRYPTDKANILHLQGIPNINLHKFQQRFEELSQILSKLDRLGRKLKDEYSLGTFTNTLSRFDLEAITKRLPPLSAWGSDEFTELKRSIMQEYHLSSNEFSKALDVIKKHRLFASEIGIELPLKYANTMTFVTFLKHIDKLYPQNEKFAAPNYSNYSDCDRQKFVESERSLWDSIESCKASMSATEIADMIAVYTFGREEYDACEFYEQILEEQLAEVADSSPGNDSKLNEYLYHYLSKFNLREFIEKGLQSLGQQKILSDIRQT